MAALTPDPAEALIERLDRHRGRHLLVVTGAGISAASGLATFRGTDATAIWSRDVTEIATSAFFTVHPVESWQWYLNRFAGLFSAQPNAAHLALAGLERWQVVSGDYLLLTQNIDGLHRRAGSRRVVEVHGRADRVRCARDGCVNGAPRGHLPYRAEDFIPISEKAKAENVPRCPDCGTNLRPHVLWFDETYDSHQDFGYPDVIKAAKAACFVLFVGTSFSVGVTSFLVKAARDRGCPMMAVDPGDIPPPTHVERVRARAEEVLPIVGARLGWH
jgi:NAD-dependent deacetylase